MAIPWHEVLTTSEVTVKSTDVSDENIASFFDVE
jgi:hypothetical protein